jgi:hypothetical protein
MENKKEGKTGTFSNAHISKIKKHLIHLNFFKHPYMRELEQSWMHNKKARLDFTGPCFLQ